MGLYVTTNLHLACTLLTLGLKPASRRGNAATGEVYPANSSEAFEWREITTKQLEANGLETIEDAVEGGLVGTIAYGFCDHKDRSDILKAYNAILHAREGSSDRFEESTPDTIEIQDADGKPVTVKTVTLISQFAALYAGNLEWLAKRRPKVPAKLHLRNEGGHPVVTDQAK